MDNGPTAHEEYKCLKKLKVNLFSEKNEKILITKILFQIVQFKFTMQPQEANL